MGQGGAKSKQGGCQKQGRPGPAHVPASSLNFEQKCARSATQIVSPTYVLKNKNLQHESYSL